MSVARPGPGLALRRPARQALPGPAEAPGAPAQPLRWHSFPPGRGVGP